MYFFKKAEWPRVFFLLTLIWLSKAVQGLGFAVRSRRTWCSLRHEHKTDLRGRGDTAAPWQTLQRRISPAHWTRQERHQFRPEVEAKRRKTRPLLTESMDPTEKDSFLMEGGWDAARLPAGTVLKLHEWGYTLVDKSLPPFHRTHPGSEQRPLLFKLNTIAINYLDGSKTISGSIKTDLLKIK